MGKRDDDEAEKRRRNLDRAKAASTFLAISNLAAEVGDTADAQAARDAAKAQVDDME